MSQSPIYLDINNNKSVITALKAGEEKVFDVVYRHYFRRLCAFCSQYVSEQEEIEEIVQETMMWLWENRCTLMEDLTLKTLLFTIVKNKALNRLSHFEIKRKVHQEIVDKYDSELNNPDFYLSDELFRLYEEALKRRIQLKLLLDEPRQTIYAFTQIRVAAGNIDLICTGEVVQHRRRSSTSSLSCSASQPG